MIIDRIDKYYSSDWNDPAKSTFDKARDLARAGDFEGALQAHIWYLEHASEYPGHNGVRLSFALRDWVKLGRKYPRALAELRRIRDRCLAVFNEESADIRPFNPAHEFIAINEYLGESALTVKFFKDLDAERPYLAQALYDHAEVALIRAQEFSLARKYVGDPHQRLEKLIEFRLSIASEFSNRISDRHPLDGYFVEKVVVLIAVLQKSGESDVACDIQTIALKVVDAPEIRDAIGP